MKGKGSPADLEAAALFYRVEFELTVIKNASPDAPKISDTSAIGAFGRLDALLGIAGEFDLPHLTPPTVTDRPDGQRKKSTLPPLVGNGTTLDPGQGTP